jgi:hypothetical protein
MRTADLSTKTLSVIKKSSLLSTTNTHQAQSTDFSLYLSSSTVRNPITAFLSQRDQQLNLYNQLKNKHSSSTQRENKTATHSQTTSKNPSFIIDKESPAPNKKTANNSFSNSKGTIEQQQQPLKSIEINVYQRTVEKDRDNRTIERESLQRTSEKDQKIVVEKVERESYSRGIERENLRTIDRESQMRTIERENSRERDSYAKDRGSHKKTIERESYTKNNENANYKKSFEPGSLQKALDHERTASRESKEPLMKNNFFHPAKEQEEFIKTYMMTIKVIAIRFV